MLNNKARDLNFGFLLLFAGTVLDVETNVVECEGVRNHPLIQFK